MRWYIVQQEYASVEYVKKNQRLAIPLVLGYYSARSIESAIKKAAKEHKLPSKVLEVLL